ncbi:MAG TPA: nidogen-like domain-containing protein [Planctomycetota bacterium]|nr:nidogen-like domain-containing protein [Planctomycetota bacterium]
MRTHGLVAMCLASASTAVLAQKPYRPPGPVPDGPAACSQPNATTLCVPLDTSFMVPSMDSSGGSGQANPADPCQFNDDDSSGSIPLQFPFNLFGTIYNDVYINNNGNISFGSPFATFTASGFPVNGFPMVAPFWGDVDSGSTINNNGGTVWFRSEAHRFIVIWDHVGYYNEHFDKTNTFELIISDGTDPSIGIGNNVCFCYDDMQWTTGDASSGTGGFGGTPATVGVNAGDGVNFFQIGRFDHEGVDYDGPGGNADGVSYLDGQTICFSAANLPGNQPPIAVNVPPGNKYHANVGVPIVISINWIGPEAGQNIASITNSALPNLVCNPPTVGVPLGNLTCTFTPDNSQVGLSFFTITATDDDPFDPQSTTITICIDTAECYLFLGFTEAYVPLGPDIDDTILLLPLVWYPVTTTMIAPLAIPNDPGLINLTVAGQVGMWNPSVYPTNPLQLSNGLRLTIGVGIQQYGITSGIDLTGDPVPQLGTNYHFAFTIQ